MNKNKDIEPEMIVAEVSRSWIRNRTSSEDQTVSKKFENIINFNLQRGFMLHDWNYSMANVDDGQVNETIVAVFKKIKSEFITNHDLRNKLTPVKNLIALVEEMMNNPSFELRTVMQKEIKKYKENIDYLIIKNEIQIDD